MSESSGLLTSPQITNVSQLTNDSGYQTASQVTSAITGYGYQTAANVKSIVTSYGYQTASQVSSAITSSGATKWVQVKSITLSASTKSVNSPSFTSSSYRLFVLVMKFTSALTVTSGSYKLLLACNSAYFINSSKSISANTVKYLVGAISYEGGEIFEINTTSTFLSFSGYSIMHSLDAGTLPTISLTYYALTMPS